MPGAYIARLETGNRRNQNVYLAGSSDAPAFEGDFYSKHPLQHSLRRLPEKGTGTKKGTHKR